MGCLNSDSMSIMAYSILQLAFYINSPLMPELPELEVVQEVLNRRILGQTIPTAESIPPGGPIVIRDRTGLGFDVVLRGAQ